MSSTIRMSGPQEAVDMVVRDFEKTVEEVGVLLEFIEELELKPALKDYLDRRRAECIMLADRVGVEAAQALMVEIDDNHDYYGA